MNLPYFDIFVLFICSYLPKLSCNQKLNICQLTNAGQENYQMQRLIIWWQLSQIPDNSKSQIGFLTERRITRMGNTLKSHLMLLTWSLGTILNDWRRSGLCYLLFFRSKYSFDNWKSSSKLGKMQLCNKAV